MLGIDLGTTFTAAAVRREGVVRVATLGVRSPEVPSVAYLRDDGELLIGEAAERRSTSEPGRVAREFKRRMGDPIPILLGGSPFSAHALTARLLRAVVDQVTASEGGPPDGIVVTRPANWGEYKCELFAQALHLAEVEATIITEPEAAAIHYAAAGRIATDGVVAVYDLGGGTFDASVLQSTGDRFELLGTPLGIEQLGGVDFDEAVFAFVLECLGDDVTRLDAADPVTLTALGRLRRDCVDAKVALSSDTEVTIAVVLPSVHTDLRLARAQFEDMIRPSLLETVHMLRRALRSAAVDPSGLDAILLVGGSSRIPVVSALVTDELHVPIAVDVHPKHAVALGAALLDEAPPATTTKAAQLLAPPRSRQPHTQAASADASPPTPAVTVHAADPPREATSGSAATEAPAPDPQEAPTLLPLADRTGRPRRRLLAGLGAAGVVAVLFAAVVSNGRGGEAGDAIVPPQGPPIGAETLLFTREDAGTWNVWRVGADTSAAQAVTNETAVRAVLPALSPDRRTIAYTVRDDDVWDLYLMDTVNEKKQRVARELAADARATWAPDGRSLAFVSERGGQKDLVLLDFRDGVERKLTFNAEEEGDPAWSPDGSYIAYWTKHDLYSIPAEGGAPFRLTSAEGDEMDPAWSPDSRQIAYAAQAPGGTRDVWVVTAAGYNPQPLATGEDTTVGDEEDPTWSPDGTRIAFETKRDAQPTNPSTDDAEIYVVNVDGTQPVRLTTSPGYDGHPAWGI